jgi:outer membrane protein OmpA-like peptidoglycan-associated protein
MAKIFAVLRKILVVTVKIVLGIFLFYLFLCLAVIPLGAPWAVRSQGAKLLKHPVQLRSVFFNPFLLRLSVKGFAVLDGDKQVMAGFEKFWVDISFIKLFSKELRVESLGLDGLLVNTVLLPDGRINLLELVPVPPPGPPKQPAAEKKAPDEKTAEVPAVAAQALPLVIVDSIELRRGSAWFVDRSVEPDFKTSLSDIDIRISGVSTQPYAKVKIVFQATLDKKGTIAVEMLLQPFVQPPALEAAFSLNNYMLQVLTPYAGKYTGRAVKEGKLDLKMDYRIADNQLKAAHKLLVQRFNFGAKVPSKDALNLPFGLAVGLLEDSQGRINISLPVSGDMSDPKFEYFHLIGQVVRNFFLKIVTKPLMFLVSIAGSEPGTEEMGTVRFSPGKADLPADDKQRLQALAAGLKERPRLLLEINGTYDIKADWKAIRQETFQNKFEAMRKEWTRPDSRLMQQLYVEFFGVRSYWDLEKKLKASSGKLDEAEIFAELKRRLIEDAPKDQAALDALAQARAQLVYDFFITEGIDKKRVSIGVNRQTQSSMGQVPLEFTLTVFEDLEDVSQGSAD